MELTVDTVTRQPAGVGMTAGAAGADGAITQSVRLKLIIVSGPKPAWFNAFTIAVCLTRGLRLDRTIDVLVVDVVVAPLGARIVTS